MPLSDEDRKALEGLREASHKYAPYTAGTQALDAALAQDDAVRACARTPMGNSVIPLTEKQRWLLNDLASYADIKLREYNHATVRGDAIRAALALDDAVRAHRCELSDREREVLVRSNLLRSIARAVGFYETRTLPESVAKRLRQRLHDAAVEYGQWAHGFGPAGDAEDAPAEVVEAQLEDLPPRLCRWDRAKGAYVFAEVAEPAHGATGGGNIPERLPSKPGEMER